MATVELTLEQLRDAIIQLPEPQRRQLLEDIQRLPAAEEARAAAPRVRGTSRMPARQRKRMSELLAMGNGHGDDGPIGLHPATSSPARCRAREVPLRILSVATGAVSRNVRSRPHYSAGDG